MTTERDNLRDKIAFALANSQRERNNSRPLTSLDQCSIAAFMGADAVMEVLAAHPAPETVTEFGVQWAGEDAVTEYQPSDKATVVSAYTADIAWARRNLSKTQPSGELVSREVTAWKPVES